MRDQEINGVKILSGDIHSFNQMEAMFKIEQQNKSKFEDFKTRIKEFETVSTIEEAKTLAEKILPIANEKNIFRIGSAKCTIINNDDIFRICVDSPEEFIAYDFAK
ncbi:hypothetical protein IJD34_07115 [bacterium]|nr:hypothetical protein [bacterium]